MRYFWLSSLTLLPLNRYIETDVSWEDEHLSSCRYSLICCDDDSGASCATRGCVGVQPGWDQVNVRAIACDPRYLFGSSLLSRPIRYFGVFSFLVHFVVFMLYVFMISGLTTAILNASCPVPRVFTKECTILMSSGLFVFNRILSHFGEKKKKERKKTNPPAFCLLAVAPLLDSTDSCSPSNKPLKREILHRVTNVCWRQRANSDCQVKYTVCK